MKQFLTWCLVLLVASTLSAQTTTKRRTRTTSTTTAPAITAEDVRALRDALAAQQQQMAAQQQQVQQLQQQLQQMQQQLQDTQAKADTAASAVAQSNDGLSAVRNDLSDLKANSTVTAVNFQEQQKRMNDAEHPTAIHFKGITITPGGFIEAAGVIRNRNENASVNSASSDGNIPFPGSPNGQLSEFRFDARQSRLSLKGEGKIGSTKVTGYYEMDFLGAAPTANENQSNSFNVRQRQLWGQVAFSNGLTFTGGQQWSLFTLARKAMENGTEFLPMTINAQYVIGYDWSRQPGFRVMKNFNNKVWFGLAVENASTVLSAQSFGAAAATGQPINLATGAGALSLGGVPVYGLNISPNATSPNGNFTLANTPGANGVSTNLSPDLVAKLTFEPGWGHFEIKAMGRFFRDRYKGVSNETTGGALGVGTVLPLVKSKMDFIAEGSLGNGFGRYGSGGGYDVTFRPDGSLKPIRTYHVLAGPEVHPTPKLDVYAYFGGEYYQRTTYFVTPTSAIGFGLPLATNTNCLSSEQTGTAAPAGSCNGSTRDAWEITPGFAYRFYKGSAGTLQLGMQFSYSRRVLWSGVGGGPAGNVSQVYTNFRYYLP